MLAARAALAPEDPWLFWNGLRGFTWRSLAQVADQAARCTRAITVVDEPPAEPQGIRAPEAPESCSESRPVLGYADRLTPDQIAIDIAAQAAGRLAMAIPVDDARAPSLGRCAGLWLDGRIGPAVPGSLIRTRRCAVPEVRSAWRSWTLDGSALEVEGGSSLIEDGSGFLRSISPAQILGLADRLDGVLPPLPDQPILFSYRPLSHPDTRALAAWSLKRGAVWVFEWHRAAWLNAFLWARPHVVCLASEDLPAFESAMRDRQTRRRSRLKAVVVAGAAGADRQDSADGAWRRVDFPALSPR